MPQANPFYRLSIKQQRKHDLKQADKKAQQRDCENVHTSLIKNKLSGKWVGILRGVQVELSELEFQEFFDR